MDPVLLFVLYRMLIVLGGILCIYFGYRLFYIVTTRQGDFRLKTGQNYEVRLSYVGPGVFFALFGAGVLAFSLINGITIKPTELGTNERSQPAITGSKNPTVVSPATTPKDNGDRRATPCMSQRAGDC